MEKHKFAENNTGGGGGGGVLKLLPGFRFHPTDQELLFHYLLPKVFARPLPASFILELHVGNSSDPWDLPVFQSGDSEQQRYFFSTREVKYPNGNRPNRATGSGYWKATGLDKKIQVLTVNSRGSHIQVVGMKKTLVFYRGKPPYGSRTNWIMHEYHLVTPDTTPPQSQGSKIQLEKWVLCHIFMKKRCSTKNEDHDITQPKLQTKNGTDIAWSPGNNDIRPVYYDFMVRDRTTGDLNLAPASSSSDSSGITEASSNQQDEHDQSSSTCNSLFI